MTEKLPPLRHTGSTFSELETSNDSLGGPGSYEFGKIPVKVT